MLHLVDLHVLVHGTDHHVSIETVVILLITDDVMLVVVEGIIIHIIISHHDFHDEDHVQ